MYELCLGCLYIRLTARPIDIYEMLEALYVDKREIAGMVGTRAIVVDYV
jgi:hypothetical protein